MKKVVRINENNIAQLIKPLVAKYIREGINERKRLAEAKKRSEDRRLTENKLNRIVNEAVNSVLNEGWEDTYRKHRDLSLAGKGDTPESYALNRQYEDELRREYPNPKDRGNAFNKLAKKLDIEDGKVGPGWDDDNYYERQNVLKREKENGIAPEEDPMDDLDVISIRDKQWNSSDADDDENVDDSEFYNDDLAKDFGF